LSILMIKYLRTFYKNKLNIQTGNQSTTTTRREEYDKNFDRNLKMTISISIISILTNSITFGIFLGFINDLFEANRTSYMKNFIFMFVIMSKNLFNFFVFYHFNVHFKKHLCSKESK
jgi:hypothetical protein